jgi:osmotically-inducible protein OsmY
MKSDEERAGRRSDSELQHAVINSLCWLFEDGSTDIAVSVVRGRVTLLGRVQYPSQRPAAEDSARALYGVTDVIDQLVVAPTRRLASQETDHRISVNGAAAS